jgi:LPS sulfotransferase NodH
MAEPHMPLLCITAAQRAGTTALKSALAGSGDFVNFREVFQAESADAAPGNFLTYLKSQGFGLVDFLDAGRTRACIQGFVDHLIDLAGEKIGVIDVKLNSWQALQPFWAFPHEEPLFMQVLKERDTAFLFIQRRDLAEQVLSEEIARATGVWHDLNDDQARTTLRVDLAGVATHARLIAQAENLYWGFLRSHPIARAFHYEDLFAEDAVNFQLADFCYRALGRTQLYPLTTPIHRNAGDKAMQILNHTAARRAIEDAAQKAGRVIF